MNFIQTRVLVPVLMCSACFLRLEPGVFFMSVDIRAAYQSLSRALNEILLAHVGNYVHRHETFRSILSSGPVMTIRPTSAVS